MSKLFYAAILFAVVALCPSCKDDDKEPDKPTPPTPVEMSVSVTPGTATECTIQVTVDNKGGSRCALVWAEDGQPIPDDQAAFKTGQRVTIDKAVELTVAPLKPETVYHIKAVVRDEEGNFKSDQIDVRTTKEKTEADVTVTAVYAKARYFPEYNGTKPLFQMTLSTAKFSTINPGVTEEGELVNVSLYVPSDITGDNVYIPDGTYVSAETKEAMSVLASSFQYGMADRHGTVTSTTDAYTALATVEKTEQDYKIFVRAFMEDGRVLYCHYDGPVEIQKL